MNIKAIQNKKTKKYPTTIDILVYILIIIFCFSIAGIVSHNSIFLTTSITIFIYLLTLIGAIFSILFYRKLRSGKISDIFSAFSFKKYSPLYLFWGILAILALRIVLMPILPKLQDSLDTTIKMLDSFGGFMIGIVIIGAPLFEETLFRGVFLNDIRQKYGTLAAIIISAIILGTIHLSLTRFISAASYGVVFGYIYVLTKSLWSVVILHAINNAIAITLVKLFPSGTLSEIKSQSLISDSAQYITFYLSCAIVLTTIISMIIVCSKEDKNKKMTNKI
ncbi:MAG: type II CAAX endopeptidase family protein [Rikenellaceae bacterium]